LDEPLKSVGEFSVAIKLHREVTAQVKVTIQAEASEEAPVAEVPAAAGPVAEAAVTES
jgi:hypothetical protein